MSRPRELESSDRRRSISFPSCHSTCQERRAEDTVPVGPRRPRSGSGPKLPPGRRARVPGHSPCIHTAARAAAARLGCVLPRTAGFVPVRIGPTPRPARRRVTGSFLQLASWAVGRRGRGGPGCQCHASDRTLTLSIQCPTVTGELHCRDSPGVTVCNFNGGLWPPAPDH